MPPLAPTVKDKGHASGLDGCGPDGQHRCMDDGMFGNFAGLINPLIGQLSIPLSPPPLFSVIVSDQGVIHSREGAARRFVIL